MQVIVVYQVALLVCTLCCTCTCYSYGPPATEHVCRNMFPEGHHVDSQSREAPFVIDLSQNVYTPYEEVQVTLRATNGYYFRGFFMQVRRADCSSPYKNDPLGIFSVLPGDESLLKTAPCFNYKDSAISHRTNKTFGKAVFRWNAPAAKIGPLYFIATVVKEQDIFWTNVYSTVMRDLSQKEAFSEYCATKTLIDPPHINTTPRPTRWPSTTEQLEQTTAVSGGNIWKSHSVLCVVLFQLVSIL